MSIEQVVIPLLAVALTPTPVRYGYIEQHEDNEPPQAPYVVVQRVASAWAALDTSCRMNTDLSEVQLQIDCYAAQPLEARRLGDLVRSVMSGLETPPSLDVEFDAHEQGTRLHRVSATYTCWDYAPNVTVGSGIPLTVDSTMYTADGTTLTADMTEA